MKKRTVQLCAAGTLTLLGLGLAGCSLPADVLARTRQPSRGGSAGGGQSPPSFANPSAPSSVHLQQGEGSISGRKYLDSNNNQAMDAGDVSLANWMIRLYDRREGGRIDWSAPVATLRTDDSGAFSFKGLKAGDYVVAAAASGNSGARFEQTGMLDPAGAERIRLRTLKSKPSLKGRVQDFEPFGYKVKLAEQGTVDLALVNHPDRAPEAAIALPILSEAEASREGSTGRFGVPFVISRQANILDGHQIAVQADGDTLLGFMAVSNQWEIGDLGFNTYAQKLNPRGGMLGRQLQLDQEADEADVAFNSRDSVFLAAWERHERQPAFDAPGPATAVHPEVIRGGLLGANGGVISPDLKFSDEGPSDNVAIAYNPGRNQFFAAFDSLRSDAGNNLAPVHILGQLFDARGSRLDQNVQISLAGENNVFPHVAMSSEDQVCLVVWNDHRNGNWDVFGRLVNRAGRPIGGEIPIASDPANQRFPRVTATEHGFLVVWEDDRNLLATGTDVYGQFIEVDGQSEGGNFAISKALGDQLGPDVDFNEESDNSLVVWSDTRNLATTATDIFGQLVEEGHPLVDGNFLISNHPDDEVGVTLNAIPGQHRSLVSWTHENVPQLIQQLKGLFVRH